jgi:hypothetical protein
MASLKQNADGSLSIFSELEGKDVLRAGGPAVASAAAPNFRPGSTLKFPVAGPTDTAGALGAWQNNLGHDILVTGCFLDVTTQSAGACTVSIGGAANGTTLNATLISGQSVAAAGTFTKATPPVQKVAAGAFITASTASGASSGLVGNVYIEYVPV